VASFIVARPDVQLLGIHADTEQASMMLKNHIGPKARAILIDAMISEPDGGRSVIRKMREQFPSLRIVAYGEDLDEMAIEGLFFLGADDVVHRNMERKEVIPAILGRANHLPDVVSVEIRESESEVSKETPRPEMDIVRAQERGQPMEVAEEAVDAPAPAVDEPAPALWEDPGLATDMPSLSTWRNRAQSIWGNQVRANAEPPPTVQEPPPTVQEPPPTVQEPPPVEEPADAMERSRPHRWRSLVRSLGLLRSNAKHRAGRILDRVKPESAGLGDDQREAITRNLQRLVRPSDFPGDVGQSQDEDGSDEPQEDELEGP